MVVLNHLVWGEFSTATQNCHRKGVGEGAWTVIGSSVAISVRVILAAVTYRPHVSVGEHNRSLLLTHRIVQCSVPGWWTAFH